MVRIMAWNIQRFGRSKMINSAWDHESLRRRHILDTLRIAHPDVFVVIEVQTNWAAGFGGLISFTSGGPGLALLSQALRATFVADDWRLVPPAIISPAPGYSEGIAVFFKSSVLTFEGPMAWTGAAIAKYAPGMQTSAYAVPWMGALPARPSQLGPNQNHLAGQYRFDDAAGNRLGFPNPNARSLWRTRFYNATTARYLSIFAVHLPPRAAQARAAVGQLAQVSEIATPPAPGEIEDRVILGDFNINVNAPWEAEAFRHLTGGPAAAGMGAAPVCGIHYRQMFGAPAMTNVRSVLQASINSGGPPYYGYAALNSQQRINGLDNAFVARSQPAVTATNATVVNRVVGTPAAGGAPQYPPEMTNKIADIILAIQSGGGRKKHFNTLINYGHIGGGRGTSDHLGIVFDLP
jgi:hypothetical protein